MALGRITWDGKVIILGWEPSGGSEPRCTETGTVLPRPQTIEENCTIHNYNVVPSANATCW